MNPVVPPLPSSAAAAGNGSPSLSAEAAPRTAADASAAAAPSSSAGTASLGSDLRLGAIHELRSSKQELIVKVQALKKELADWRGRINQHVESYRSDLGALQASLTTDMGALRGELADVKARIRQQLEANDVALGTLRAAGTADPPTQHALAAPAMVAQGSVRSVSAA